MNVEVMEQLLKDLAANVGYDLIPAPFDTPFEKDGIKVTLPSRFIWPIPVSVLRDESHKDYRKTWIDADLIDTVLELSWAWPGDENEHMAILLINVMRSRRGSVKFVDATSWNIEKEEEMAAVCNLLIHDLFPGEHHLAFLLNEDLMDLELDNRWNEQVCLIAATDIISSCETISLQPADYIVKPDMNNKCRLSDVCDIECSMSSDKVFKLEESAIVLSSIGKLNPSKIVYKGAPINISLKDKIVLVPDNNIDIECIFKQLISEEVLRQLPLMRRINFNDMWHLLIDTDGLFLIGGNQQEKEVSL